jgi:hypothetical protein
LTNGDRHIRQWSALFFQIRIPVVAEQYSGMGLASCHYPIWVVREARYGSILLKKSLTVVLTRFSEFFLPLTGVRERFVGRSERSLFSPGN